MQILATDGLVNFYLPGYVQTGFGSSIKRIGGSIKGKFTDTNDQVIDAYITARPDAIAALGALVRGGASMRGARQCGARGGHSARQGRRAGPGRRAAHQRYRRDLRIAGGAAEDPRRIGRPADRFLLHDLDSKVQIAAIETTGLLRNSEAVPDLIDVLNRSKDAKVRRAALTALAMLPDEKSRPIYEQYLQR